MSVNESGAETIRRGTYGFVLLETGNLVFRSFFDLVLELNHPVLGSRKTSANFFESSLRESVSTARDARLQVQTDSCIGERSFGLILRLRGLEELVADLLLMLFLGLEVLLSLAIVDQRPDPAAPPAFTH